MPGISFPKTFMRIIIIASKVWGLMNCACPTKSLEDFWGSLMDSFSTSLIFHNYIWQSVSVHSSNILFQSTRTYVILNFLHNWVIFYF
jgi:hypothetical protein